MERDAATLEHRKIALLQAVTAAVHQQNIVRRHFETAGRNPVVSFVCEPLHGLQRFSDMHLKHFLIALIVGDLHDLVPMLGFSAMRHALEQRVQFVIRHVLDQWTDILETIEDKTHVAGQGAVSAAVALGCFFQDTHARVLIERGMRGRTCRITSAHDQNIVMKSFICHLHTPDSYPWGTKHFPR